MMNSAMTPTPDPGCSCPDHRCAPLRSSRRRLLGWVVAGLGVLLLPARALAKKVAVRLDSLPMLKQVGGFVIAMVKDREILLIRDSPTTLRAAQPLCTHKSYRLQYDPGSHQIVCKNHGSRFDLKGKVQKGPADRALPVYPAELDAAGGRVIIKLD
jgi:nitrite reductase/ring-hydroxylating ferredoxin subunit